MPSCMCALSYLIKGKDKCWFNLLVGLVADKTPKLPHGVSNSFWSNEILFVFFPMAYLVILQVSNWAPFSSCDGLWAEIRVRKHLGTTEARVQHRLFLVWFLGEKRKKKTKNSWQGIWIHNILIFSVKKIYLCVCHRDSKDAYSLDVNSCGTRELCFCVLFQPAMKPGPFLCRLSIWMPLCGLGKLLTISVTQGPHLWKESYDNHTTGL